MFLVKIRQLPYFIYKILPVFLYVEISEIMFSIQFLLIILFACVFVGLLLGFFKKNQEIKLSHVQKIQTLNQSILLHKTQLTFRDKGLLQYNFLKYNLDESLIVQPNIKLI